ncbi:hypothetical protein MSPP1_003683 [Malassezia sp. CBS 17886]|nr:hypothetical protein MSPP1_003683 [Malassezia sp. CBS 17886]
MAGRAPGVPAGTGRADAPDGHAGRAPDTLPAGHLGAQGALSGRPLADAFPTLGPPVPDTAGAHMLPFPSAASVLPSAYHTSPRSAPGAHRASNGLSAHAAFVPGVSTDGTDVSVEGAAYPSLSAASHPGVLSPPLMAPRGLQPVPVGWNVGMAAQGCAGTHAGAAAMPYYMAMTPPAAPLPLGPYPAAYGAGAEYVGAEFAGARVPAPQAGPPVAPMGRTVYVGNLPADASVDELLDLVKFGPIENVRLLPEKTCAFISFLSSQVAAAFHADSSVKRVTLHSQELKIGWGRPSAPPPAVVAAVQQQQASRNVYIGQLDEAITEQSLRDELGHFGPIDQVKIVRDQGIAFVHFLSIQTAMYVVAELSADPAWHGRRVNFGKDRCAYVPKGQQQIQAHNHQAAAMGLTAATWLGYPTGYANFHPSGPTEAALCTMFSREAHKPSAGADADGSHCASAPQRARASNVERQYHQFGNRTVYLGNLHPDTTIEDICNHVRGGILQTVRHMRDRHIAFVTFVDPHAALTFFHLATIGSTTIHNRRLKVGWGKQSGPLSPALALAVQSGASRNVYMGNIAEPEQLSEEKIRMDLSAFGELEMVNTLRERNCAFANFVSIQSAIQCIERLKYHDDYKFLKIAFGKDRCGNPPRFLSKFALNWTNEPQREPPGHSTSDDADEQPSEPDSSVPLGDRDVSV